jgi:hypothetical protein
MKCHKASLLVSLAASVGALMAVSAPAHADGYIVSDNNAADCVYSSGAVPSLSANSNLYNGSTTATSVVICPVSWTADTGINGLEAVVMIVSDKSTAGNVSCALNHVTENGATVTAGTAVATSGSTSSGVPLVLTNSTPAAGGNYFVKCTLGKKGGFSPAINGYEIYATIPPEA